MSISSELPSLTLYLTKTNWGNVSCAGKIGLCKHYGCKKTCEIFMVNKTELFVIFNPLT
jgi:hypothetical protein